MPEHTKPVTGWIGLGDPGLPMAVAIAEAGYTLHVWARRPGSFQALGDVPHVRHGTAHDLGAACDIVGLCVSTDDDVMAVVSGGLLDTLRPGSVVVNHGTGTPGNAARLTELCAAARPGLLPPPGDPGLVALDGLAGRDLHAPSDPGCR